jgi:hypothetical protein
MKRNALEMKPACAIMKTSFAEIDRPVMTGIRDRERRGIIAAAADGGEEYISPADRIRRSKE